MKNILVTGATGFIASHLLPILHQQGWQIVAPVRHYFQQPHVIPLKIVVVGDIDGDTSWQQALEGIDTVIHMAASAHNIHNSNTPESTAQFFKVNTLGTKNLVQQAIQAGVKHFIFISSIGAMATLSDRILTENSACQPDTPYGCSKLQAEQALIELANSSTMDWTIVRPTLVYGQGNPGNMERLIKLVEKKLPLPFASLNNRRSFVYVGNLVSAITTILTHPQASKQIFLISDGADISTTQLIIQIAECLELPYRLLSVPMTLLTLAGYLGDATQMVTRRTFAVNSETIRRLNGSLWVDNSKICQTLNWKPPYTFEEGLRLSLVGK